MQHNNYINLLKLTLIGLLWMAMLLGCVSESTTGKNARHIDKTKALELHVKLAQGYVDKGNRESARHHLRKAYEIDKNSPEATATQALLYQLEGEPVLAEESFKKALKKKKGYTMARNNYGVFLFTSKRYEEALTQFELAAADLDFDGRAQALINVGRTSLKLGNNARAKAAFEHAFILDRTLGEAFIELAELNFHKQEYSDAKQYLDKYMELGKPSARSLLLGIRLERIFGNKNKEASYALALKNLFPYSKEYLEYTQTLAK